MRNNWESEEVGNGCWDKGVGSRKKHLEAADGAAHGTGTAGWGAWALQELSEPWVTPEPGKGAAHSSRNSVPKRGISLSLGVSLDAHVACEINFRQLTPKEDFADCNPYIFLGLEQGLWLPSAWQTKQGWAQPVPLPLSHRENTHHLLTKSWNSEPKTPLGSFGGGCK